MKLNIFKKKEIQPTPPPIEQSPTPICPANHDKPECSLIEELRDIQYKLKHQENFMDRRIKIMEKLTTGNRWSCLNYYGHDRYQRGLLDDITNRKYHYKNIDELNDVIQLLSEYKDILEEQGKYDEYIKSLRQREKEIKQQLGIE